MKYFQVFVETRATYDEPYRSPRLDGHHSERLTLEGVSLFITAVVAKYPLQSDMLSLDIKVQVSSLHD